LVTFSEQLDMAPYVDNTPVSTTSTPIRATQNHNTSTTSTTTSTTTTTTTSSARAASLTRRKRARSPARRRTSAPSDDNNDSHTTTTTNNNNSDDDDNDNNNNDDDDDDVSLNDGDGSRYTDETRYRLVGVINHEGRVRFSSHLLVAVVAKIFLFHVGMSIWSLHGDLSRQQSMAVVQRSSSSSGAIV
jgi:hypothetical protein